MYAGQLFSLRLFFSLEQGQLLFLIRDFIITEKHCFLAGQLAFYAPAVFTHKLLYFINTVHTHHAAHQFPSVSAAAGRDRAEVFLSGKNRS